MVRGERIRAAGFFKLKSEAKQWVKDEKNRLTENQKRYSSQDKDLSLWTLAQQYLADCKINYDKKTFDEKRYCLERFYKFAGDIAVIDIDPPSILEFINDRAKTQSNNAANKDRKNLKAFYSWIQEMYGVMYDPTAPIKKKPPRTKLSHSNPNWATSTSNGLSETSWGAPNENAPLQTKTGNSELKEATLNKKSTRCFRISQCESVEKRRWRYSKSFKTESRIEIVFILYESVQTKKNGTQPVCLTSFDPLMLN